MHLDTFAARYHDGGDVRGYHRRYAALAHRTAYLAALVELVVVYDSVDRKIGLDAGGIAGGRDVAQVVDGEVGRRAGTHVEPLDTEIYGIGAGIDCGMERLEAAHRRHYLKIFSLHKLCMDQNLPQS